MTSPQRTPTTDYAGITVSLAIGTLTSLLGMALAQHINLPTWTLLPAAIVPGVLATLTTLVLIKAVNQ